MTTPTIYFAANEDEAMYQIGGGAVVTTAGTFRSGITRCALQLPVGSLGGIGNYWINALAFAVTTFWQSARMNMAAGGGQISNANDILTWLDSNGARRLAVRGTGGGGRVYKVVKVDSSGTETALGSPFVILPSYGSICDKLDCDISYAVSGHFNFYQNEVLLFSFSGDITTNSVTSLAYSRLGFGPDSNGSPTTNWSELIVSDTDTRSWGLQTLQPVANGNTHNFDTGTPAAANVNEIVLNDGTFDGSTTAGQIDQYTIPALASGFFIVSLGVSARVALGATGPTKVDLGVRSTGTDYWSADKPLLPSLQNYQNWWSTDPATSAPWTGLPVNIGLKSVT